MVKVDLTQWRNIHVAIPRGFLIRVEHQDGLKFTQQAPLELSQKRSGSSRAAAPALSGLPVQSKSQTAAK
jgi:hypothetical protein